MGVGMPIAVRLWLIVATALVGIALVVAASLFMMNRDLRQDREIKTRHIVEVGTGILAWYEGQERQGGMSREQAQAQALSQINALRYDKVEYLWVHRLADSVMLAHPNAKLVGTGDSSPISGRGRGNRVRFPSCPSSRASPPGAG